MGGYGEKLSKMALALADSNFCGFDRLPKEMLEFVLFHLDGESVVSFSLTCKKHNHFVDNCPKLWKYLAQTKYSLTSEAVREGFRPGVIKEASILRRIKLNTVRFMKIKRLLGVEIKFKF